MKLALFIGLALACFAMMNCKKETKGFNTIDITGVTSENIQAQNSSAPKFGVLPNNLSSEDKITVAKELGVEYVRNAIVLKTFDGKDRLTDMYLDSSFKMVMNLNYDEEDIVGGLKQPHPFPTDMTEYIQLLSNVLDVYKPSLAVIENEPYNDKHYTGPIENYIIELTTAIAVCHQYGIKVADGGLNSQMVCVLTYQNLVNQGKQQEADDFAAAALLDKNLRLAQGKGSVQAEAKLAETDSMINAYKTSDLDFVNIHWYEPIKPDSDSTASAPGALKEVADYLRSATGKKVITNEFGQNNELPSLVKSMVDSLTAADFKCAIDFSGEGASGAVSLTTGTKLKPNGRAYRNEIAKQ